MSIAVLYIIKIKKIIRNKSAK